MKSSNWFVRSIEFVSALILVRWMSRTRINLPGWVLLLGGFLLLAGLIIWKLAQ